MVCAFYFCCTSVKKKISATNLSSCQRNEATQHSSFRVEHSWVFCSPTLTPLCSPGTFYSRGLGLVHIQKHSSSGYMTCSVTGLWPDVSTTLTPEVTRGNLLSFGKQCSKQEAFYSRRSHRDGNFMSGVLISWEFQRLLNCFPFRSSSSFALSE